MLARLTEMQRQVGQLRIQVNRPGAEVFVDGKSIGVAPISYEIYVDPGTHLVEARLDGFPPAQVTITAAKAQIQDVPVALKSPPGANKGVIVAGAVVTGVAAITGAVLAGLDASKASSANTLASTVRTMPGLCPAPTSPNLTGNCATLKSDLDAKAAFGTGAVVSFTAAGAIGLTTLIYGLASGSRGARSSFMITPIVTADGGGVFANGSF